MKKNARLALRLLTLILLFAMLTNTVSCGGEDEKIEQSGIEIKEDGPIQYSQQTLTRVEKTVFSLLKTVYSEYTGSNLPEATIDEIEVMAGDVADIMISMQLGEGSLVDLIDVLDEKAAAAIEELVGYYKNGEGSLGCAKALYLSLSEVASAEYVGRLFYRLSLYSYDYRYDKTMARYEKYGYPYLLEDAQKLDSERERLKLGVGEDNFSLVLSLGLAMSDILVGALGEEDMIFSDEEIAVFLEHIEIDSIDISDDGWEFIISMMLIGDNVDATYLGAILDRASENGDLESLASVMDEAICLLSFIQGAIDEADVASLRTGATYEAFAFIFSHFTEREWQSLDRLVSFMADGSAYSDIGHRFYGDEFSAFESTVSTLTLDELILAQKDETFYESFEGYLAGKSLALAFLLEL